MPKMPKNRQKTATHIQQPSTTLVNNKKPTTTSKNFHKTDNILEKIVEQPSKLLKKRQKKLKKLEKLLNNI